MNKQSSQWKSRLLSALAVAQRDLLSLLPHLVPNQPPGGDGGAGGGLHFALSRLRLASALTHIDANVTERTQKADIRLCLQPRSSGGWGE